MKITCPYCQNLFNDTLEKCPHCGAPNAGVVRRSGGQPITIEELKDWYQSKGLPPYETTRFFIGENYQKPRAFGIYKDEETGNFIVYKNKDSGERAVRYQGTDEAYAVNELYQRLKQEIIQQKSAQITQGAPSSASARKKRPRGCRLGCLIGLGLPLLFIVLGVIALIVEDAPEDGYYSYQRAYYCHYDHVQPSGYSDWFRFDADEGWKGPLAEKEVAEDLKKNEQAQAFFLSAQVPAALSNHDFVDSVPYQDIVNKYTVDRGYYQFGNTTYYHLNTDSYAGWYAYDAYLGNWRESAIDDVPYELQHDALASDFYYTPTWDSSTQITDFTDSSIYEEYLEQQREEESSSSRWDDDDDSSSWSSGDSWDSGGTDWSSDW